MAFFKTMWKNSSRHKKLSEELALQNAKDNEEVEVENDVVTFKLKYLGSTVVEKVQGEKISIEAVKSIVKTAKASRKKLTRVHLNISLKGIAVTDSKGNDILKVSVYRISNCSTDPSHRQVFSFVSTDSNETTECHAFICSKRKTAETVTLAVAHAFSTAYEAWRILPTTKKFADSSAQSEQQPQPEQNVNRVVEARFNAQINIMDQLIDFDEQEDLIAERSPTHVPNDWVSFEDEFSALSRRNNNDGFKQMDLILA